MMMSRGEITAWAVTAIIFGVILLLPGACSVFFIAVGLITGVGILGLAIGALGIWMIWYGISALRRR